MQSIYGHAASISASSSRSCCWPSCGSGRRLRRAHPAGDRETHRPVADRGRAVPHLDRLEDKGYVTSSFGDPTPARGGRSKRYFKIAPARPAGAAGEPRRAGRHVGRSGGSGDAWLVSCRAGSLLLRSVLRASRRRARRRDGRARRRQSGCSGCGGRSLSTVSRARAAAQDSAERENRDAVELVERRPIRAADVPPQSRICRRGDRADRARASASTPGSSRSSTAWRCGRCRPLQANELVSVHQQFQGVQKRTRARLAQHVLDAGIPGLSGRHADAVRA